MPTKTEVSFRISGPCLSFLLRDGEFSKSDQVGFLIGESSSVKSQIVSDDDMEEERIETTISINGTFQVGLPYVFCSPVGKIDETILKDILGDLEKDVVGWYSFRRNCNHRVSLLQMQLHRELRQEFTDHIPPQNFMFCMITKAENDDNATHSFKFTFFVMNNGFEPVSVAETNLGEPEDNVYRNVLVNQSSKHLEQVVRSLNGRKDSMGAVMTLHKELSKHINSLQIRVDKLQTELDSRQKIIQQNSIKRSAVRRRSSMQSEDSSHHPPSTSGHMELSTEY